MTDQVVQSKIKELVHAINSECVVGAGGPGMYLDGDRIFMLLYDGFNSILEQARLEDTVASLSSDSPKPAGRPMGSKNKVVI